MDAKRIHPSDNVFVALKDLPAGESRFGVALAQAIPAGHKAAIRPIGEGERIVKYGQPIGAATRAIRAGEWVHTHNARTLLDGTLPYRYEPEPAVLPPPEPGVFRGYLRESGRVGTRNEVWVLPTVGCVSVTAQAVAARADALYKDRVDGVYAFPHVHGCSQMGHDLENTKRALVALARHPNAGAVLILGLGCEFLPIEAICEALGDQPAGRVEYLNCQEAGDERAEALACLDRLTAFAAGDQRSERPLSDLVLGLKCGGSDGFSGLTANPLLGRLSDALCALGGTTLLTEVPEMFGAEHLLMARCADEATFRDTVALINDYKRYLKRYGEVISENPAPGNKKGGITTLEDKSLGCIQKGGGSPVTQVLRLGEYAEKPGLALVDGPGNDLCAVTNLTVSGATLVLFTTGRGTPYGGPVPTLKLSTNSELARKKPGWIDFDAGGLAGGEDMGDALARLRALVIDTASGAPAKNEQGGYREITIFKDGVTL